MATHKPVGLGTSIAIFTGTATTSSVISVQSDTLRVVADRAGTHVAIGVNPTASPTNYYVPANGTATLTLSPASQTVVAITTGTDTIIHFPEGTGSPFSEGDYVTLTSVGQPYYNFTHQPVILVDRTSSYDGYFSTRVSIGTNTSGILTAFSSDGDLRKSVRVSSYGTGSGVLYILQVQIAGDA
jgi:hypothetical protein